MRTIEREKLGGVAALVAAATFVFGFVLFATVLSDYTTGDPTPAESVAFVVDHEAVLYLWNAVIFILFGVVLVPLVLALHELVRAGAPVLASAAAAFGIIWAGLVIAAGMIGNIGLATVADLQETDPTQAQTVWSALDSAQNGLGGGNEIVGGLWVLLVSWAALQTGVLPTALNYVGIAAGAAGIVTIVPALEAVGAVFGLGLIVWFVWAGVVLFRRDTDRHDRPEPELPAPREREPVASDSGWEARR
jgi:hypothetical protein